MADQEFPDDLRFSREDEWARLEAERIVVGITSYAQDQLGDIVFVELPELGARFAAGESFGVVESVKAVSELCAPVGGRIVAVNGDLADNPERVNEDCYGAGWMVALEGSSAELEQLLDAAAYRSYVEERSE